MSIITVLAIGTLGDVLPYVALGAGLEKASYDVTLATHTCFADYVTRHGLGFRPLSGEPDKWAEGAELNLLAGSGSSFRKWMLNLKRLAGPLIPDILESCRIACRGTGLIIYSPLAWAGCSIAEKMGVPSIAACLQPMSPTRIFPSAWSPAGVRLGGTYNFLTHHLAQQFYWHLNRPFINKWRIDTLGIPPLPYRGPFGEKRWRNQLFLCAFSPLLVPRPKDWPDNAHVTGFWFPPEDISWQPDRGLVSFLEKGPPPLYIGFGSMPEDNPSELREIILDSLRLTGQRAVVQGKWPGRDLPDSVYPVDWVSHPWIFSRCCAAIHHGGAGTTARSLKAGIPGIVIPYAWDQFFWGERAYKLGVAPKPIRRTKLSVVSLVRAIEQAVSDVIIKDRAAEFGRRLSEERGVETAVEIISRWVQSNGVSN
jgi:sterol 3beta-glucosyltransferase